MTSVFACVVDRHNIPLILVALALCVFSMATTMYIVKRINILPNGPKRAWLLMAAVVAGCGIWSTHFVAMLAYHVTGPVGYEPVLTALSIVLAVTITAAGYGVLAFAPRFKVIGGSLCGAAIAAMHYVGMAALETPARISYDPDYVFASIAVSMPLAVLAYQSVFDPRTASSRWALPVSTILAGAAIISLHFVAMAGLRFTADPLRHVVHHVLDPHMLGIAILAVTFLIVAAGLSSALLDAHLARRAAEEMHRLRTHVIELEDTRQKLESTAQALAVALEAASAGSAAKSRFLATMSHELRTPLNAIIGFAELMQSAPDGPLEKTRSRDYAGIIRQSGTHLLSMIKDVLDLTQIDSGHLRLLRSDNETEGLIVEVLHTMAKRADLSNVKISYEVEPAARSISADRDRARQVLVNLVSNGVKFTAPAGAVHISAKAVEGGVAITVRDTGIGIAPGDLERVLERFVQADNRLQRRYDGSGLGLSLAKDLMELHGGTLSIESVPGQGTSVTVTFPGAGYAGHAGAEAACALRFEHETRKIA